MAGGSLLNGGFAIPSDYMILLVFAFYWTCVTFAVSTTKNLCEESRRSATTSTCSCSLASMPSATKIRAAATGLPLRKISLFVPYSNAVRLGSYRASMVLGENAMKG